MTGITHLDEDGGVRMVDLSGKEASARRASASAHLRCARRTVDAVRSSTTPKGSAVAAAKIAGILAAKRTAELIPLCHPLPLTHVELAIDIDDKLPGFRVTSEVRTNAVTGVEMEALMAVSVACLTLFDMLKAIDHAMIIGGIEVTSKLGGKSGEWHKE